MVVDLEAAATQEAFAVAVGITQQQVSDLVQRGVLGRESSLGRWLLQYTSHLREQAAGRSAMQANERARFEKLKADRQEMINAQMRGELVPAELLEEILADYARRMVVVIESVPVRLEREHYELGDRARAIVREELDRMRADLAELDFPEQVVEEYIRQRTR